MRFPGMFKLFGLSLFADLVVGAFAYGFWRWLDHTQAEWLAKGDNRLYAQIALGTVALLTATLLFRWLVYIGSSWQPGLVVSLVGTALTPFGAAILLRLAIEAVQRDTTPPPTVVGVPYRRR